VRFAAHHRIEEPTRRFAGIAERLKVHADLAGEPAVGR
jgi:hypothetical protein